MQSCQRQSVRRRPSRAAACGPSRAGFSLIELLVVVGILVILVSIFVPYVAKMREAGRRVGCADNLRRLFEGLTKYAEANGREFPRAAADPGRPGMYVAFTGADDDPPPARPAATTPATTAPATVPAAGAVRLNDVTASLWLLVRGGYADPQQFVCPSADETPDPVLTAGRRVPPARRSNFTSGRHLSYSYSSPFSGNPRFRLNTDVLPGDFAILADQNPGTRPDGGGDVTGPAYDAPRELFARANSRNHGRAGQNVLYSTGPVAFQATPYCGYGPPRERTSIYRDHVYTAYRPAPVDGDAVPTDFATNGVCTPAAGPAWVYDSYLVPTDDE